MLQMWGLPVLISFERWSQSTSGLTVDLHAAEVGRVANETTSGVG